MDDAVITELRQRVGHQPHAFWTDRRRVDALLADVCGTRRAELFALRAALEVVPVLAASSGNRRVREKLSRNLSALGLDDPVARWAVGAWAYALGLSREADVAPEKEGPTPASPPKPRSRRLPRRIRSGSRRSLPWKSILGALAVALAWAAMVVVGAFGWGPVEPSVTTLPFKREGRAPCPARTYYGGACTADWTVGPVTQREEATRRWFDVERSQLTWKIGVAMTLRGTGGADARTWDDVVRLCGGGDCFPRLRISHGEQEERVYWPARISMHQVRESHAYRGVLLFDMTEAPTRQQPRFVLHWLGSALRLPPLVSRLEESA